VEILILRDRVRCRIGLLALAACLLLGPDAGAQASGPALEDQVKAAFLYNFAKFVDWPEERALPPDRAFVIGVLGDSSVLSALKALEGQRVRGRPVEVRQFVRVADADCQLLFVDASQTDAFARGADKLRARPILTVGETDEFLLAGGAITLVRVNGNIRYRVNTRPAEAVRLTISSKLLKLADRVQE
jgi:YfiR/HmsC-like